MHIRNPLSQSGRPRSISLGTEKEGYRLPKKTWEELKRILLDRELWCVDVMNAL